jgi:hypothetical protein
MRKSFLILVLAMSAVPVFAATESFHPVPVVDSKFAQKVASNPDEHTRACAMACSSAGFVVVTPEKILKLDKAGNSALAQELKASQKKDHLRADVTGEVEGDTLKVQSIKLL